MSENDNSQGNLNPVFDNEMAEILESFFVESNEIIERLGQDLLALEKNATSSELHNVIFRAVHTLKGTSSFLGFDQMTSLGHRFEDVLNKIRKGELNVTRDKMDVMFEAYDLLKLILQNLEAKSTEKIDLTEILAKLQTISTGDSPAAGSSAGDEFTAVETPAEKSDDDEMPSFEELQAEMLKQAEEEEKALAQGQSAVQSASAPQQSTQSAPPQGQSQVQTKTVDSTIRVDVARLDTLMNLVGELVLGRNRLTQISHQMNEEHESLPITRELSETNSHIDFITTELQMAVMKTRMVPIGKVFNKIPRLVRELAKETGKELELVLFGEETELDKSLGEELNDPLVHLIRNASDHGVEMPDEREKKGKPRVGTVTVRAEHEGNHIVISVADDGKGMDPEKLKQKAIEKGILTEGQAREMSKTDAFNLIFAPGFSTAQKVTNVSGRGVGMDVVRTNVSKLKGTIDIESEIDGGSKFVIKLPLTLAIIQALLVEVRREIFSIPLDSVIEVVRVDSKEISSINNREVIRLRDTVLPLARLGGIMGVKSSNERTDRVYIVVVGVAEQRLGIIVDSLLGQKEVVIKSIGEYLGNIRGIAGSTILGDGRVIMIIDVGELMKLFAGTH